MAKKKKHLKSLIMCDIHLHANGFLFSYSFIYLLIINECCELKPLLFVQLLMFGIFFLIWNLTRVAEEVERIVDFNLLNHKKRKWSSLLIWWFMSSFKLLGCIFKYTQALGFKLWKTALSVWMLKIKTLKDASDYHYEVENMDS